MQHALGVPVNFSTVSLAVNSAFTKHGDMRLAGGLQAIADLLDHGVKVHLVYGDRDFACNWIGGEMSSLAIPHKYQKEFAQAGYTPLTIAQPDSPPFVPYGLTRQHGNLSFSRVFQAGHMVPSYQPEASLRIFERALFNRDIATGEVDLTATGGWKEGKEVFATEGPGDTWWRRNEVMPGPEHVCYLWSLGQCNREEIWALRNGTAVVKDYFVVGIEGETEDTGKKESKGGFEVSEQQQTIIGLDEL